MRDILPTLDRWLGEGLRFAVATVVRTWGSSPRPVGAMMGIREDGIVVGSVSGGCVEAAVVEAALGCLASGNPRRVCFDAPDERAIWEVGLSCGGQIDVWIEPEPTRDPVWLEAAAAVRNNQACLLITQFEPLVRELRASDDQTQSREADGRFFHVLRPRDRLLIIGASHIALPLIAMARILGFETVLVDPRKQLLVPERLAITGEDAGTMQVREGWPQAVLPEIIGEDAVFAVVLSHDPKIDDPALAILLRSRADYIGALGSKTTQAKRRDELRALGFTDPELSRIHGPIGLDIGARSPEEIALSILAEIIQVRSVRGESGD